MHATPLETGGGERGVTLIELLVVLAVIGIVTAIAIPRIDAPRYRIEGAMRGIGSTLFAAQRLAMTRQHDIVVHVDQGANGIRVHEDVDNDGVVDPGERVRGEPLGEHVVFGRGGGAPARPLGPGPVVVTKRKGGYPAVTFHRNGSASERAGFYLTSRRALTGSTYASDTRAIEIERATGRASWFRYINGQWQRGF